MPPRRIGPELKAHVHPDTAEQVIDVARVHGVERATVVRAALETVYPPRPVGPVDVAQVLDVDQVAHDQTF